MQKEHQRAKRKHNDREVWYNSKECKFRTKLLPDVRSIQRVVGWYGYDQFICSKAETEYEYTIFDKQFQEFRN